MTLDLAPEYQEARNNKKERKNSSEDVSLYLETYAEIKKVTTEAVSELKTNHPKYFSLLETVNDENEELALDAAKVIGTLQKKKPEIYALLMKAMLVERLSDLNKYIRDYTQSVLESEHHSKRLSTDFSTETMTRQEEMDSYRSMKHDAMMDQLAIIIKQCKNLDIDIPWSNMVGYKEDKEYRAKIQAWAQHIADYLAIVSESTV